MESLLLSEKSRVGVLIISQQRVIPEFIYGAHHGGHGLISIIGIFLQSFQANGFEGFRDDSVRGSGSWGRGGFVHDVVKGLSNVCSSKRFSLGHHFIHDNS